MVGNPKLGMLVVLDKLSAPLRLVPFGEKPEPFGRITAIIKKSGHGYQRGFVMVKTRNGNSVLLHRSWIYEYKHPHHHDLRNMQDLDVQGGLL